MWNGGNLVRLGVCRDLRQHQVLFTPPGGDHVEQRLAAGLVEGAAQYLAVYGDDALAGLRKLAREPLKAGGKLFGIEEAEHPGESVVARQSLFELQELPKKCFLLSREQLHIRSILAAAEYRAQRNDHDLDEIMKPGVAGARILQIFETSRQTFHASLQPSVLDASAEIDSPKDRKAKLQCQTILKCDSPARWG